MTLICFIKGLVELLLLISVAGILFTLTALFSLLELMIITINPICLYCLRQSGQVFTSLMYLVIRRVQHIPWKMCCNPMNSNEQNQEPIVATIEPLPPELQENLSLSPTQQTYAKQIEIPIDNNLPDSQQNLEEASNEIGETSD